MYPTLMTLGCLAVIGGAVTKSNAAWWLGYGLIIIGFVGVLATKL